MPAQKEGLRDRLIDEALKLLAAEAPDISLRSVARAAGVSAMTPYRHFADKAALLGAAADRGFAELRVDLEAADARATGRAALVEQGLAYIAFAQRHPGLFRLMFVGRDLVKLTPPEGDTAFDVLSRRVAAEMPAKEAAGWTLGCWAIVHGMAMLTLDERVAADAVQARAMLTLLLRADPVAG